MPHLKERWLSFPFHPWVSFKSDARYEPLDIMKASSHETRTFAADKLRISSRAESAGAEEGCWRCRLKKLLLSPAFFLFLFTCSMSGGGSQARMWAPKWRRWGARRGRRCRTRPARWAGSPRAPCTTQSPPPPPHPSSSLFQPPPWVHPDQWQRCPGSPPPTASHPPLSGCTSPPPTDTVPPFLMDLQKLKV